MQLTPNSLFPVTWIPSIGSDTTTYYPRAVIRNRLTGIVLDTLDLVKQSDNSYVKNWRVINDLGNTGTIVDVTVSVWTDSGHTVISEQYNVEQRQYKVQQISFGGGGGGNGESIDYDRIEKFIEEKILLLLEKLLARPDPEIDLSNLVIMLVNLGKLIQGLPNHSEDIKTLQKSILEVKENAVSRSHLKEMREELGGMINSRQGEERIGEIEEMVNNFIETQNKLMEDIGNNVETNNKTLVKESKEELKEAFADMLDGVQKEKGNNFRTIAESLL